MNVEEFTLELDSLLVKKELTKVEPFLQTTLEYAKKEEDYSLYLAVENELLGFYRRTSQFEKAFLIADDDRFATLYTNMGFLLQEMEQWDTAERLLCAASSILEKKESC